jgi:hypothetical protein
MFVIWASYGFRYSAFNPHVPPASQFIRRWELIEANIGFQGQVVHALARLHALPEAFLYGYSYVVESAQSRAAFLNGEYSMTGWRSFFPWTFLLKTTPALLIALLTVATIAIRRWAPRHDASVDGTGMAAKRRIWRDVARVLPLVILFGVYWAFSLTTHLNIGQRHIQPTYPVLFIGAGAIVAAASSWRSVFAVLALLCAGWQTIDALRVWPDYLAYFNPIGGGPSTGYRHLVDSSLDWGQDLPGLKTWLGANTDPATNVYLSYFGTGEPQYYGIKAKRLVMLNGFRIPQPFERLEAGVYCVSATCLQQVYSRFRGPWTMAMESAYQQLRQLEPALIEYTHGRNRDEWLKVATDETWSRQQAALEDLRFARLCHYLRARDPIAQIGYSINVYSLTTEEINRAVYGDLASWRQAIVSALELRHASRANGATTEQPGR